MPTNLNREKVIISEKRKSVQDNKNLDSLNKKPTPWYFKITYFLQIELIYLFRDFYTGKKFHGLYS